MLEMHGGITWEIALAGQLDEFCRKSGSSSTIKANDMHRVTRTVLVLRGIMLLISRYVHGPRRNPRWCAWPVPEDPFLR